MNNLQAFQNTNAVKKSFSFNPEAPSINNLNLPASLSDSFLSQSIESNNNNNYNYSVGEDNFFDLEHNIEYTEFSNYQEESEAISSNPIDIITTILQAIDKDQYRNQSITESTINELVGKLGTTLYNQSILDNGQISALLLHMKNLTQKLGRFESSKSDAEEHLKQLLIAARNMQRKPYTTVQDSYWSLKMKILDLFHLQPDPLNAAAGRLREILVHTPRSVLTLETQVLLNQLNQSRESQGNEVVTDSKGLSKRLEKAEGAQELAVALGAFQEAYKNSGHYREIQDPGMVGVAAPGLGFFRAENLETNEQLIVTSHESTELYKSDFLSYAFYALLKSKGKTATMLLKSNSEERSEFLYVNSNGTELSLRSVLGVDRIVAKSEEIFRAAVLVPETYIKNIGRDGFIAMLRSNSLGNDFDRDYRKWLRVDEDGNKKIGHGAGVLYKNFTIIRERLSSCEPEYLYDNVPNLQKFMDPVSYSRHFLISLLTNPKHQSSEHFAATIMQSNKVINSIRLTEIRHSETLAGPEEVKSVVYLMTPMDTAFSSKLADQLQKYTAESLLFDWLASLEEQNRLHQQMVDQGAWSTKEVSPFQIPYDLIPTMYQKLTCLLEQIEKNPQVTHQELLDVISPETARIHKEARTSCPTAKKAFIKLEQDNIHEESTVVKRRESIREAAARFFQLIKLEKLRTYTKVAIIGKALAVFPEACGNLVLPGNAANPDSRQEFFIFAVQQGHIELVKRLLDEEKLVLEGEDGGLRYIYKALQAACDNLDVAMIELLTSNGFSPRYEESGTNNLLSLCIGKFAETPIQASAVVRHLLEKTDYFEEGQTNSHIVCPLRLLFNVTKFTPAALEAILPYFVKKGFNIDSVDNTKRTPLHYAIDKENERLIRQLIFLRGGQTFFVRDVLTFFNSHAEFGELFETLKKNSLLIRWHSELQNFMDIQEKSNLEIPGFGHGYLAPSAFADNKIHFTNAPQLEIRKWEGKDISRFAAEKLFELLIGHGITYSCFATHTYEKLGAFWNSKVSDTLWINQIVSGESLAGILRGGRPKELAKIDPLGFSELLLLNFLVNFQSVRSEDLILEIQPHNEMYRITYKGLSEAFCFSGVQQDNSHDVGNALFCLPQMDHAIHPAARERFLSFNPAHILELWGEVMSNWNNESAQLDFSIRSDNLTGLRKQFERIQSVLRANPPIKGIQLLQALNPRLGEIYKKILTKSKDISQRVTALGNNFGKYQGASTYFFWGTSGTEPSYVDFLEVGKAARQIGEEEGMGENRLLRIREALLNELPENYDRLCLDTTKQRAISGIDFSKAQKQDFLLKQIEKSWLQSICINGCTILETPRFFEQLSKNSPLLSSLELKRCTVSLATVAQVNALKLKKLSLVDIVENQDLSLQGSSLRHIRLVNCQSLTELTISTSLEYLSVEKLPITSIGALGNGSGNFTLKTFHIKECLDLELWSTTLQPLLKQWKELWLHDFPCPTKGSVTDSSHPMYFALISCLARQPKAFEMASLLRDAGDVEAQQTGKLIFIVRDYLKGGAQKLELTEEKVSDQELLILGMCCPDATTLVLQESPATPSKLSDQGLIKFAEKCPNIRSLTLRNCPHITWDEMAKVALVCKKLETLDLGLSQPLNDGILHGLIRFTPNLKCFVITKKSGLTSTGLESLADHCLNLRDLRIEQCDDPLLSGLTSLGNKLVLNHLELGLESTIQLASVLASHKQLENLVLQDDTEAGDVLSNADLKHLDKSKLTRLCLRNCNKVNRGVLEGFENLLTLELSISENLTMEDLEEILPKQCPELALLILQNAAVIKSGNEGLQKIMPGLTVHFEEVIILTSTGSDSDDSNFSINGKNIFETNQNNNNNYSSGEEGRNRIYNNVISD